MIKWKIKQTRGNNRYEYTLTTENIQEYIADIEFYHKEDAEANARLIAAAPNLLAACEFTLEVIGKSFSEQAEAKVRLAQAITEAEKR